MLIPAFKRADTIEAAVRSALAQTWTDLEVVVVDDDSQDDTAAVLARIEDPRLLVLSHDTNQGGNAARRTAITASRGEYLAFLDADDLWLPTKIEKQVASLEGGGPRAGLSYTWYDLRHPGGRIETGRRPTASGPQLPELLQGNLVGTFSVVMVRREVLEAVGLPDPTLPSCQDWEFYIRVNSQYEMVCVPEVLALYWRDDHDVNRISASAAKVIAGHREVYARIVDRLDALPAGQAAQSRRYFMETFANHADLRGVGTVAAAIRPAATSVAEIRFTVRMAARAARKSAAVTDLR